MHIVRREKDKASRYCVICIVIRGLNQNINYLGLSAPLHCSTVVPALRCKSSPLVPRGCGLSAPIRQPLDDRITIGLCPQDSFVALPSTLPRQVTTPAGAFRAYQHQRLRRIKSRRLLHQRLLRFILTGTSSKLTNPSYLYLRQHGASENSEILFPALPTRLIIHPI